MGSGTLVTDSGYLCYPLSDFIGGVFGVDIGFISFNGEYSIVNTFTDSPLAGSKINSIKKSSGDYMMISWWDTLDVNNEFSSWETRIDLGANTPDSSSLIFYGDEDTEVPVNALFDEDSSILYLLTLWFPEGENIGHPIFSQFDTLGNLLKRQDFFDGRYMHFLSITPTYDRCYLLSYTFFPPSQTNTDCGIMKVNGAGEVLWSQEEPRIGGRPQDYVLKLKDESIIRVWCFNHLNTIHIEHLDAKGEYLTEWALPDTIFGAIDGEFTPIHELKDGCILFQLMVRDPSNGSAHPVILKYDPFGNLLWWKHYMNNPDLVEQFQKLNVTPDQGFLMTGYTRDAGGNNRGWAMKVDCHGNLSSEPPVECAEFDCTDYPIDAFFTASDTLIDLSMETGTVQFHNSSPYHTSIIYDFDDENRMATTKDAEHTFTKNGVYNVKLDVYVSSCHTSFKQNIHVINAPLELEEEQMDNPLNVYPNPSSNGVFTLTSKNESIRSIHVTNPIGQSVLKQSFGNEEKVVLNLQSQAPGHYHFEVEMSNGEKYMHQVVISE